MSNLAQIVLWYQTKLISVEEGISHQEKLASFLRSFEPIEPMTMSKAINKAALEYHPHQKRLYVPHRQLAESQLVEKISDLESCTTFKQIYATVKACIHPPFKSALLFNYDLSLRIGAYKRIYPQKVYLHTGSLEGAQAILGKIKLKRSEPISIFPREFAVLKAYEIEDCLCIYKKDFIP